MIVACCDGRISHITLTVYHKNQNLHFGFGLSSTSQSVFDYDCVRRW